MRREMISKRAAGLGIAVGLAAGLSGCGSAPDNDFGNTLGNLFAYNSTKAPPFEKRNRELKVECPVVQVADGQSAYRAFANSAKTSDSVRYQFSFGDIARDCVAENGQIAIRVGVSGLVIAGPAGGPGNYTVPVRVTVRRDADNQPVQSKVVRVAAAINPGEGQGAFNFVTETMSVPYTREEADQDYSIYVGFDPAGAGADKPVAKKRKRG